jgi:hypothetical protein
MPAMDEKADSRPNIANQAPLRASAPLQPLQGIGSTRLAELLGIVGWLTFSAAILYLLFRVVSGIW